jgi:hypothetical protein
MEFTLDNGLSFASWPGLIGHPGIKADEEKRTLVLRPVRSKRFQSEIIVI